LNAFQLSKEFKVKSDFSLEPFSGALICISFFLHCSIFKVHSKPAALQPGSLFTLPHQSRFVNTFFESFLKLIRFDWDLLAALSSAWTIYHQKTLMSTLFLNFFEKLFHF